VNASARARNEQTAKLPPHDVPAYRVTCPRCHARPGFWCEAVLNLPTGTRLRDPHDDRVQAAQR